MESILNHVNSRYIYTVKADLFRYGGANDFATFIKIYFLHPEFKYTFWMRTAFATGTDRYLFPIHVVARFILRRLKIKLGINIPYNTSVMPGFYIGHCGGIVVGWKATIGWNCNISTGVVVGESFRGDRKGVPTIGDRVYIGPGAKVFGSVKIGDDVAIGANSVVTKDVPDNAVVVGVPARIISKSGSKGYISNMVEQC